MKIMAQKPKTRTATPKSRDPKPTPRTPKYEHFVPASAQCVCPKCGSTVRVAQGRHVDPVREIVLNYCECSKCGNKVVVEVPMNDYQRHEFCTHKDAVAEYQRISRR